MKVLVAGYGNMARTYAYSFLSSRFIQPTDLWLLDNKPAEALNLPKEVTPTQVHLVPGTFVTDCDIVVLAVKPQDFTALAQSLKPFIKEHHILFSMMAEVKTATIIKQLGSKKVVRAMPNLPAQIGMGMTVFTCSQDIDRKEFFIMQIDLKKYSQFVEAVTSKESNDLTTFMNRLDRLDANYEEEVHGPDINVPLMITAALGLSAESGEFTEVVKKLVFQGKPLTEENVFHMKRELGDIMWYWVNACRALNLDPNDVIAENVKKLEARYPGGKFDAHYSENRKAGDI